MPSEVHPLAQSLANLLRSNEITHVDIVSYVSSFEALRDLGVLRPRGCTRILLVPPNGITRSDVHKLLEGQVAGQEIRQVDLGRVAELVHLKLIVIRMADGRQFAVTGSANYTKAGTRDNCEFSVLFELQPDYASTVTALFDGLWEHGSQDVNPDAFASVTSEEREHNERLVLLPFQDEALEKLKQIYDARNGRRGALLSLPTGAGKTIIAAKFLLDRVLAEPNDYVLWLAPHKELLFQAASTFERMRPFFRCQNLVVPDESQVVSDTQHENANVAFRTIHDTHRNGSEKAPKVVVIDEAHWGAARSREMLPKLRDRFRDSFFLGLTGTPFRKELSELLGLGYFYGEQVHRERSEIETKTDTRGLRVLATVQPKTKNTGYTIDLDEQSLEALELNDQVLREFNDRKRNRSIAQYWQPEFGRTLVFAVDIDHANALAHAFGEECRDVAIQVVHSGEIPRRVPSVVHPDNGKSLSAEERQRIHKQFRRGDIQILIAVNIYTMGVDFPAVETLFMARPTLSPVVYSQMLGRGLRGPAFGGTESVRVIDFADQIATHDHLRDRIMRFQRFLHWAENSDREFRELKKVFTQCLACKPAQACQQLTGQAGVYRVTTFAGNPIEYRGWRSTTDIGKAVYKGRQDKTIRDYYLVTYLPENDSQRRAEILSKLRLADSLRIGDENFQNPDETRLRAS
jgi:superfamily II DNA or RNA helicase